MRQPGHVEAAHGGTLFVEQLQHATPPIQDRLLRLMMGRVFFDPVSGEACESDVRIVASIPLDLEVHLRSGRILPELAQQLGTVQVSVQALAL